MSGRLQTIDRRRRGWRWADWRDLDRRTLGRWLPVVVTGIYVVLVLVKLGAITHQIWWDSDSAEAGVFAQLHTAGSYTSIGYHGWFAQLAFMLVTRSLPAHRLIWYAAPYVVGAIGLAALWATAARSFGRLRASIAVAGLLVVGVNGLYAFLQPTAHGLTITAAALVCAGAVWVLPGAQRPTEPRLLATAVALGIIGGLPLGGDSLYWVWVVLPMLVALAVFAWRGPTRARSATAVFAAVVLAGNVIVAELLASYMHGQGFHIWQQGLRQLLTFATPTVITANLKVVVTSLPWLYGVSYFGQPIKLLSVVQLIGTIIVLVAVLAAVVGAVRLLWALAQGRRLEVATAAGGPLSARRGRAAEAVLAPSAPPASSEPRAARRGDARLLHVCFWATVLLAGLASFLLGNPLYAGSANGIGPARYLIGPVAAAGALLPWLMRGGARRGVSIGAIVAVLGVIACVVLESVTPIWYQSHPSNRTLQRLKAFAAGEHVRYGYGPYWITINTMWYTGFQLRLYPITRCGVPFPVHYCASPTVSDYSWYTPRSGIRSMFITTAGDRYITHPPAVWGRPIARERIGYLRIWVYPFDLASALNTTKLHEAKTNTLPPPPTTTIPLLSK